MVHQDNPRVRGQGHTDPPGEAREPAEGRRRKEAEKLLQARKYHEALDSNITVAVWWREQGFDKGLRQRFLLGAHVNGGAVIPFWSGGSVQGFILRRLEAEPEKGKPEYKLQRPEKFVTGHRPLFVPGPPPRDWSFLVEDYVDALALAALGYPAVAIGGPSISEHQMEELSRLPGTLYILPSADEDGMKAARKCAEDLYPRALLCPPDYGKEKNNA